MKETKIQTPNGVNQILKETIQEVDKLNASITARNIQLLNEVLADKDKKISQLEAKIEWEQAAYDKELERKLEYSNNLWKKKYLALESLTDKTDSQLVEKDETITRLKTWPVGHAYPEKENNNLTKIQGILTSNLRSRKSSNTPYMAFFRPNNTKEKHSLEECEESKCQDCELPVIFRVSEEYLIKTFGTVKINLKKGDKVILEGKFSKSKSKSRPSFTCYSYQIIKSDEKSL